MRSRKSGSGKAPRVLDLFAGCGGMSLGFQSAGCSIVAGLEIDPLAAMTHHSNFIHSENGTCSQESLPCDVKASDPMETLKERTGELLPEVDIVVGGPPCQAYARVGRAKLREIARHPEAHLRDERGSLHAAYLKWVEVLRPKAVVMENVPDILHFGGINLAELIAENLELLGYRCRYTLLNSAFFGVPQTRERWFLIGILDELNIDPSFPTPTHRIELPVGYRGTRAHALRWKDSRPRRATLIPEFPPGLRRKAITCEEALGDLPSIGADEKAALGRGRRNLDKRLPYRSPPGNPFQTRMRNWPDLDTDGDVSAHVIRSLPRDYPIFALMEPGADYPRAHQIAVDRFERELIESHGKDSGLGPGNPFWDQLRRDMVPPYDPGKFPNKWWKLDPDFPSRTLMAHLSHDSYSHIHYDAEQARTISVREAARLQSFPDGFEFCGAMNAAFKQVGNAVPPLLAEAIAVHLLKLLNRD